MKSNLRAVFVAALTLGTSAFGGAGAQPSGEGASDSETNSALIEATNRCDLKEVNRLLERGASVEARDSTGTTPLMIASVQRNTDILGLLLNAHADVHAVCDNGYTALTYAARAGHPGAVHRLMANGSDVKHRSILNRTPIYAAACGSCHYSRDGRGTIPVDRRSDHVVVMDRLVAAGGDVNVAAVDGTTPLIIAVTHGRIELVRFLLKSGASTDAMDENGDVALTLARDWGYSEIEDLLMEHGAL